MMMAGIAAAGAVLPLPSARAVPGEPGTPPGPGPAPAPGVPTAAAGPAYLFHDEFDGPAGSSPDTSKWVIYTERETIKNPVFWDRPENMGQYRNDRRNVFLDGNSNLVIRATKEDGKYFGGKLQSTFWGNIGHTFEARIKFDCLTNGAWPAWWLLNNDPNVGGEVDLVEWYGNQNWPSGTTVHARLDGTSFATNPFPVDNAWHVWRMTWDPTGMYFWRDYAPGMEPYFAVPANSLEDWPFNFPDYTLSPVLNLAVGGSGGGDPAGGNYPCDMLVDWVRVW
jgi:beta-glucanase (GH16 family)